MAKINIFFDHPYSLGKMTHVANFFILTPEHMEHIRLVNFNSVRRLLNTTVMRQLTVSKAFLKRPKPLKSRSLLVPNGTKSGKRKKTHTCKQVTSRNYESQENQKITSAGQRRVSKSLFIQFRFDRFNIRAWSQTSRWNKTCWVSFL